MQRPGFTMLPNWLLTRLTRDPDLTESTINRALRLYIELRGRFTNFYTGRGSPTREALAEALGVDVKTLTRTLDVLRAVGAVRTERQHDSRGYRSGLEYFVFGDAPDPDALKGHTALLDKPRRARRPLRKNPSKNTKEAGESFRPKGQESPGLKGTGAPTKDQDLEDQDLDLSDRHDLRTDQDPVVVEEPERQQQQRADEPPDDDPANPTVTESLQAFYASWSSLHDRACYDIRASDERHMADIVTKAQEADVSVLDLIESYLSWREDDHVVHRHHPLGLLAVNVGRVIAYHRGQGRPRMVGGAMHGRSVSGLPMSLDDCPHSPPCSSLWDCGQLVKASRAAASGWRH